MIPIPLAALESADLRLSIGDVSLIRIAPVSYFWAYALGPRYIWSLGAKLYTLWAIPNQISTNWLIGAKNSTETRDLVI